MCCFISKNDDDDDWDIIIIIIIIISIRKIFWEEFESIFIYIKYRFVGIKK